MAKVRLRFLQVGMYQVCKSSETTWQGQLLLTEWKNILSFERETWKGACYK